MLGYTPGEVRPHASSWSDLVHPDDLPGVMEVVQQHLEGRIPEYHTQHRMRTKTGEWRWILDRGRVIERGPGGEPLRMIGTHTDITEQKQAEAAVAESERRFRLAARATRDVIWDWNAVTGEIWWSEALTTVFGYPPASPREYDYPWWLGRVHPEDRPRLQEISRRVLAGEDEMWYGEYRLLRRSGYQVLSAANGREALAVLDASGASVGLVLTDVVMPEMNGPELHRALRERGAAVPVLYMSGYADEELVRRGALSRESTVLQKPFEPETLLTAIRAMLDAKTG